jgi:hypothetical protein
VLKFILKEMEWNSVNWILLAQNSDRWQDLVIITSGFNKRLGISWLV